jgi:hypothetical protein
MVVLGMWVEVLGASIWGTCSSELLCCLLSFSNVSKSGTYKCDQNSYLNTFSIAKYEIDMINILDIILNLKTKLFSCHPSARCLVLTRLENESFRHVIQIQPKKVQQNLTSSFHLSAFAFLFVYLSISQ